MATVALTEDDDRHNVRTIADIPEDIFLGLGGDDVFIIDQSVSNLRISGTNGAGDGADGQWDTIELFASAQLNGITAIDALKFMSSFSATTLTYNANSHFGVSQVEGSTAGIDTIHFTSASEAFQNSLSASSQIELDLIPDCPAVGSIGSEQDILAILAPPLPDDELVTIDSNVDDLRIDLISSITSFN